MQANQENMISFVRYKREPKPNIIIIPPPIIIIMMSQNNYTPPHTLNMRLPKFTISLLL